MIETGTVTVLNKILCEDVRQEQNNKHILIGVYSGDMLVGELPANVQLSFYLELAFKSPGDQILHLRLSGPGKRTAELKMAAQVTEIGTPSAVTSPRFEVLMDQEGVFRLDLSDDGVQWVTLIEKRVIHQPGLVP